MQHVIFEFIDSCRVDHQLGCVVSPESPILKDRCQPWRSVGELLNLDRFFDDDAVRANPGTFAYGEIEGFTIASVTDVRLSIHGKRSLPPYLLLQLNHAEKRSAGCFIVGERTRVASKVPFPPE